MLINTHCHATRMQHTSKRPHMHSRSFCLPTLQVEGVAWLLAQHQRGLNSILADEMGLGKTLQSIAFLATLKWGLGVPGPHLVVVPLSVMSSWMAELARWELAVSCDISCCDLMCVMLMNATAAHYVHLQVVKGSQLHSNQSITCMLVPGAY
jgi:hypothetical protein